MGKLVDVALNGGIPEHQSGLEKDRTGLVFFDLFESSEIFNSNTSSLCFILRLGVSVAQWCFGMWKR